MESLAQIKSHIQATIPDAPLEIIPNDSPSRQPSLLVGKEHAVAVAKFLRDDPELRLDYCSNATVDGVEREVEETVETRKPGHLEAVYHLYSMEKKRGPVVIRMRTGNRTDDVRLPSLTPIWRGCEFQEREIYDLYGIVFDGHPDLRRILMWDGFKDFPMRKDYAEPDDYEYEPTPHDQVLEKAKRHYRQQTE